MVKIIAILLSAAAGLAQPPAQPAPSDPPKSGQPAPTEPAKGPGAPTPASPAPPAAPEVAIPFPHPMISEILYAVPTGPEGDANKDGTRHVSGDEFVEIYNPHDKPIQLFGYTLTDSALPGKGQVKFVFPALELPSHGVAVVFNGNGCGWTDAGPVGDSKAAPSGPSEKFGGAYVFTMRITSQRLAFSNSADSVTLTAPDGKPIHRVAWGKTTEAKPKPGEAEADKPLLDESAPVVSKSSIQRDGPFTGGSFRAHIDLPGYGDMPFSPGTFRVLLPCPVVPAPPFKPDEPKKPAGENKP